MVDRIAGGVIVSPVRNSRLVDVKFQSPDPDFAAAAANTVAQQYIQQNLEFRATATSSTNTFLTGALQDARKALDDSEAKLQAYKEQHNGASIDDKSNIATQKLTAINAQLVQAQARRDQREDRLRHAHRARSRRGSRSIRSPRSCRALTVQKLKADVQAKQEVVSKMAVHLRPALSSRCSRRRRK